MTIPQHICSLLYQFDCVIIPGFGGFVANYHPAQINTNQNIVFPPSKGLLFNKNLLNNDGLLADAISQKEQISYADSILRIEAFVSNSLEKLKNNERVEIDEIGFLFFDDEKNIQFKPEYSANFLVDAFGLYPVVAKEIFQTVKEVVVEQKVEEVKIISIAAKEKVVTATDAKEDVAIVPIKGRSLVRKYWPAAAVLLPLAFYSYWIPFKTNAIQSGHLELSDFNPFHQQIRFYQERTKQFVMNDESEKNEWLTIIENTGGPVAKMEIGDNGAYLNIYVIDKPVAETTSVVDPIQIRSTKSIHLIGGCFKELANAEKMVSDLRLKGYESYILDQSGGLNRVVIQSFSKKDEAIALLNEVRTKEHSGAWILEK